MGGIIQAPKLMAIEENNKTIEKKRRPINISNEAYIKSREIADRDGYTTFVDYVNETLIKNAERDNFIKMFAPYLKEDYVSQDAVYIKDSKLNKIAVVRLKMYPVEDLENSGFYAFCETCASDSCIHIKHSLLSGSILKLKPKDRQALEP